MSKGKKKDKKQVIIEALEGGVSITTACQATDITRATFFQWLKGDKKFEQAIRGAKESRIGEVEDAIFKRATGYEAEEERLTKDGVIVKLKKHIPPDTPAAKYYLDNRDPSHWKTEQHIDQKITGDLIVKKDF